MLVSFSSGHSVLLFCECFYHDVFLARWPHYCQQNVDVEERKFGQLIELHIHNIIHHLAESMSVEVKPWWLDS